MAIESALRQHIRLAPEKCFDLLLQPHEIIERAVCCHVHQNVDVARRRVVSAENRQDAGSMRPLCGGVRIDNDLLFDATGTTRRAVRRTLYSNMRGRQIDGSRGMGGSGVQGREGVPQEWSRGHHKINLLHTARAGLKLRYFPTRMRRARKTAAMPRASIVLRSRRPSRSSSI